MSAVPEGEGVARAGAEGGPEGEAARPARPKGRRSRWWLWPLAFVLQLVVLVVLAVAWVLGTESGLRSALALAEDLSPGLVRVEAIEGRVAGDLHLRGLSLRLPALQVDAAALDLSWRPLGVLSGTLRVRRLAARQVRILTEPSPPDSQPLTLPAVVLPLGVEVDQALVEGLAIGELPAPGEPEGETAAVPAEPFVVERVALSASLKGGVLELRELAAELPAPRLAAKAQGRATLTGDYPLTLDLDWTLTLPAVAPAGQTSGQSARETPAEPPAEPPTDSAAPESQATATTLMGKGRVSGDLSRLHLDYAISGVLDLTLTGDATGVLERPAWDAALELHRIDLPAFGAELPTTDVRGSLQTVGDLDQASVTARLEGSAAGLPDLGRLNADLDLHWAGQTLHIRQLSIQEERSGARLDAAGDLALAADVPRLDVQATWERLRWPLTGAAVVESRSGKAAVSGAFDAYAYQLSAEVGGTELPAASLELKGEGSRKDSRIHDLQVATLGGRIQVEGEGAWDPLPRWILRLSAEGIDPSKQWADWSGRLGGRVETRGVVTADGPDVQVHLQDVSGELRGYPVAAAGQVRLVGETLTVEGLNASSGPSKAQVSGTAGERLDLAFAVDSPDLATLLPEARGSIRADGSVLGAPAAPDVKLKLSAKGVEVAGQGVAALDGDVDLGLGPDGRFAIRVQGRDLSAGGLAWRTLEVRGEGSMANHRLSADVQGDALSVRLKAEGALSRDNAYQGQLAELDLASKDYGTWRLQRPAPLTLVPPKASVGPLCLRDGQAARAALGGGSGGCVRFEQVDSGKWTADLDLDRLAFVMLARLLPSNLALEGAASLKGRFAADGPVLSGSAELTVPEGRVQVTAGRQTQVLDFSSARLSLDSSSKGLGARLHLPLAGIGGADADLTLAGWRLDRSTPPDQPLSGRVQARVADLGHFASLVPDLSGLTGSIVVDLGLDGSLAQPGIKGGARLSGGGFDVPIIGLKASNLELSAEGQGQRQIVYRGGLDLGGGRLELTGDSLQQDTGWLTKVRISGQKLKVADSKQYFALISPDIGVQFGPAGLELNGELRVPEARIRPRDIPPGTVSPASDVVLDEGAARQAEPFPIAADLRLVLGDEVSIDAFGLRGLLRGDLRVIKAPGREPVGDGQVSVEDGTYRLSGAVGVIAAIGKPLKVEQGILVFAKTPLNNPGLVLTAQRQGGDTTAGVRVLGTLKKPKLAFFSDSDPDMSQSEITSYLVTGIPPKRGNADDARALAVGTYISPKLYMEYESNLGAAADKVKLRYELSNRIELQTETGSGQGADIFYKFEH